MIKIALIEDNQDIRENLEELLEMHDYRVVVAENGSIGIDVIEKEMPDVVLCDVAMPQMDGYEVLEFIRTHPKTKNIPFIFITASAEQNDILMGKMAGANDYLAKPFSTSQLIESIKKCLGTTDSLS